MGDGWSHWLTTVAVTRYIVGYKKEESDYLLKFLYDHIALSQDLQTRIRWKAGTVVVWDVSTPTILHEKVELSRLIMSRTVWRATRPSSIGRMARDATSPVSPRRQSRLLKRRLKAERSVG